ncbi:hypothetical protein G6F35_013313 [Rhizopus arrhizus]|nr:hypothetical protein G6F35_013313 [Rhizopus arrhizus]
MAASVDGGARQHGHQRTRHAVARAVHDAQEAIDAVRAEDIEVAAHHVARLPQHEVVRAQGLRQLAVRQDGALDQAGVVDGVADLLVRGGHGAIGVFQFGGAFAHLRFQFGRVLADLVGHDAEGPAQVADFVLAARGQAHVVAAVRDRAGRLLQAAQGAQHQPLDGIAEAQQHGGKQHRQADGRRPEPTGVQHPGRPQVHDAGASRPSSPRRTAPIADRPGPRAWPSATPPAPGRRPAG